MAGEKEKNGRISQKFIQGYVRIKSWQCSRRVLPMRNFQSKKKGKLALSRKNWQQNT